GMAGDGGCGGNVDCAAGDYSDVDAGDRAGLPGEDAGESGLDAGDEFVFVGKACDAQGDVEVDVSGAWDGGGVAGGEDSVDYLGRCDRWRLGLGCVEAEENPHP